MFYENTKIRLKLYEFLKVMFDIFLYWTDSVALAYDFFF